MPSTRRSVLRSSVGLVSVLAGCGANPSPDGSPTTSASEPPRDALADPPTVTLRNPDRERIVRRNAETTTDDSDGERERWWHFLVADAETTDSLSFADVPGVERARRFLADTDFDAATVYVEQFALRECYDRELCWIRWTDERIETDYASVLRDADVACDVDAEDVVATLVRLPVALDSTSVTRFSSGSGSDHCRTPEADRP